MKNKACKRAGQRYFKQQRQWLNSPEAISLQCYAGQVTKGKERD